MTHGANRSPRELGEVDEVELIAFDGEVVTPPSLTAEQIAAMAPGPGEAKPVPADYADAVFAVQSIARNPH